MEGEEQNDPTVTSFFALVDENIADSLVMVSTNSEVAIRQLYGRCVLRALQQPLDRITNDVSTLFSTLLIVMEDEEASVRGSLLNELPKIIIKCRDFNDDCGIYDRYLNALISSLEGNDVQLRKSTFSAVKFLLEKSVLDKARLVEKVCPAVVKLSNVPHKNNDVESYSYAIELMGLLVPKIGPVDAEKLFLERFLNLCLHENCSVRRWCADYLPVFCYVLGRSFTQKKLIKIFEELANDYTWGVRKSAAKSLSKIALVCALDRRRDTFAPIAYNLLNDDTRYVSETAFKYLGELIATFGEPCAITLEYGQSGRLYIGAKANYRKLYPNSIEENTLTTGRPKDSDSILQSVDANAYREFLNADAFSIQTKSLTDSHNPNATLFQRFYRRIFNSMKLDQIVMDKQLELEQQDQLQSEEKVNEQELNGNDDDDDETSSGIGSAGLDIDDSHVDVGHGDVGHADVSHGDVGHGYEVYDDEEDRVGCTGYGCTGKRCTALDTLRLRDYDYDYGDRKDDLKEVDPDEVTPDDFEDECPDDILDQLPEGLRPVMKEIRKRTSQEVRQRNRDARVIKLLTDREKKNRPKAEKYAKYTGPLLHKDYPNGDMSIACRPFPWEKKYPNVMIVDNTEVKLRWKGKHQSNAPAEQSHEDEEEDDSSEYNSLNFWYHDPSFDVDVDDEIFKMTVSPADAIIQLVSTQSGEKEYAHFKAIREEIARSRKDPPDPNDPDVIHKKKLDKLMENCVGPKGDPRKSYFYQPIVPPYLIEYFVSMERFADSEFNMYCAYSFPAVVLTLRKENWHLSYDLLLFLASDIQWKVRKTLAMFICDIAQIIGREYTQRDLMPMFLAFFKDLDEVKIEALKNLPVFLSVIDIDEHPKIISNIDDCLKLDNESNWRFREEMARQLLHLIRTYDGVYSVDYMFWITGMQIKLLTDKISSVRTVAMDAIAEKFCNSSAGEQKHLIEFLVEDFARHAHWRRRQMFVHICTEMISKNNSPPFEVIEEHLLPHILVMAAEQIPNIRIAVGRFLSLLFYHHPHLLTQLDHPMMETMMQLQGDEDNDVKDVANYR